MKIFVTEYLRMDLDKERWECRNCSHDLGNARDNYKKGLLVYARDPREIHKPLIDPKLFEYTFAPDPEFCVIYEFYCPNCGTMFEAEYQVPGALPDHDIDLDVDALKEQWKNRKELSEPTLGPDTNFRQHAHSHKH